MVNCQLILIVKISKICNDLKQLLSDNSILFFRSIENATIQN